MKHLFFRLFLVGSILFNGSPLSAYSWNSETSKMSFIFSAGAVFGAVCGWFTYKSFVHKRAELIDARDRLALKWQLQQKDEEISRLNTTLSKQAVIVGLPQVHDKTVTDLRTMVEQRDGQLQKLQEQYDKLFKLYNNSLMKKHQLKQQARQNRQVREAKQANNNIGSSESKKRERSAQQAELRAVR